MSKAYFKLAINIPSCIWVFTRWFSISWIENYISPVLEKVSLWSGIPMMYIEGILIGAVVVGSIWWLVSGLKGKAKHYETKTVSEPLEDIKSDLVTLNACERETATIKAETACFQETAMQICNDFISIFGTGIVSFIMTLLQEILRKDSVDPLIAFFKKFGDILDSNGYGLKTELENNDLYKSSRTDLAQKRLKLKMGKKKKTIAQKNIDRVRSLSYGLSSSILLRSVLDSAPETKEIVPSVIRVTLEGIETAAEEILNAMLNDLENEWEINKETRDGIEATLAILSALEGVQGNE